MKLDVLAARRQVALEKIADSLNIDLTSLPKAPDTDHRQLFILERIAEALDAHTYVEVDATDSARKLAMEHGIDLSEVEGTGTDGRILKSDVEALIDEPTSAE